MWEDVVIGSGDKLCSAIRCNSKDNKSWLDEHLKTTDISENSNCYWIKYILLNARIIIFKNTEEGKQLTQLIEKESFKKLTILSS